ncbi:MAG: hypothetical protein A2W19_14105 [Spirochaetes bacterium RBG_16_49_21]|nr:MAG: hypothetical protein A2W19_14105 [Spirochaetes bacterium RBG_16_49_21]
MMQALLLVKLFSGGNDHSRMCHAINRDIGFKAFFQLGSPLPPNPAGQDVPMSRSTGGTRATPEGGYRSH